MIANLPSESVWSRSVLNKNKVPYYLYSESSYHNIFFDQVDT